MTVWIAITCPGCHSTDVIKNGKTPDRKQRYINSKKLTKKLSLERIQRQ